MAVLPGGMDSSAGVRRAQVVQSDSEMFTSSTPLPGLDSVIAESATRPRDKSGHAATRIEVGCVCMRTCLSICSQYVAYGRRSNCNSRKLVGQLHRYLADW